MQPQRYSYQREQIYAAMQETGEHPTAEMVYTWLKPSIPRLSLGTVYRNLRQLVAEGRLAEIPGPVARYDAVTRPHTHFFCTQCGAVSDLPLPYDGALDRQAAQGGWNVRSHSLIFYGICPNCTKSPEKTEF